MSTPTNRRPRSTAPPEEVAPKRTVALPSPDKALQATFLEELAKNLGVVEVTCLKTGIDRERHDEWMADPNYKRKVQKVELMVKDFAKAKLLEMVDAKSPQAVLGLLKRLDDQDAQETTIPVFSFEGQDEDGNATLPDFKGDAGLIERKAFYLRALERALGNVTAACRMCNISRQTVYRWLDEDEAFVSAERGVQETCIDYAEKQLFKQIKNGEVASTIFFLKTRGRGRGYSERQVVQLEGGDRPVMVNQVLSLDGKAQAGLEQINALAATVMSALRSKRPHTTLDAEVVKPKSLK